MTDTGFRRSAIMYGNPGTWIYTGVGIEVSDTDPETVERYDYTAATGRRLSYYVGERRFMERTFRWQSDALLDSWRTFWRTHAGKGKEFYYYDKAPPVYDTGLIYDTAGLVYDGSVAGVLVVAEPMEFRPTREDAYGYWSITMNMRRVV